MLKTKRTPWQVIVRDINGSPCAQIDVQCIDGMYRVGHYSSGEMKAVPDHAAGMRWIAEMEQAAGML